MNFSLVHDVYQLNDLTYLQVFWDLNVLMFVIVHSVVRVKHFMKT